MAEDVGGIQASVTLDDSGLGPKLARLRSAIGQIEDEMQALQRQMQGGTGDTKAMADSLDVLSSAYALLTDRAATMAAASHLVHSNLDCVGKATSSAASEMMAFGQHADEMQSKTTTAARTTDEAALLIGLKRGPHQHDGQRTDRIGEDNRAEKEPGDYDGRTEGGEVGRRTAGPLASLEDRLAHLTHVEQRGGGILGGSDYEPSTKVVAGDDRQFTKLQEIGKTLEEIRKLYSDTRPIGVRRRR